MCGVLLFVYAHTYACSVCFYALCDCGKTFKEVLIVVFSGEKLAGRLEDYPVVLYIVYHIRLLSIHIFIRQKAELVL